MTFLWWDLPICLMSQFSGALSGEQRREVPGGGFPRGRKRRYLWGDPQPCLHVGLTGG